MLRPVRPILGVMAAEANSIEQRQILEGIIGQAQQLGYDTAVFSNVFNPNVLYEALLCENNIYNYILSDDISAIILIAESFVNETLRQKIAELLKQRKRVPMIVVGTYQEVFDLPGARFINTNDKNDFVDITTHLIEVHGCTDIDILTGHDHIEVSHLRADGYKQALREHGIPVDESKIRFGDFWMTSGKDLAQKYISGEEHMPQAVICANDYMAYGMLDEFARNNISVPDQIIVTGYEYIDRRTLYTPLLTTYRRSRSALGRAAVRMIHDKLNTGDFGDFSPPNGSIVLGDSCPCGRCREQYLKELDALKFKIDYQAWNLFSSLNQDLTNSRNLDEFAQALGKNHWLVRDAKSIFICLNADWYDSEMHNSDNMVCREIVPWLSNDTFEMSRYDFSLLFSNYDEPAAYYFAPLFFSEKYFGSAVIRYDVPDTYDDIFRNWIKTVCNSLEFLRMKNDIQYLSQCQNLSSQRDTLTGMYNDNGMEKAYRSASPRSGKELCLVMLKICLFDETVSEIESDHRINAVLDAAKAVGKFCGNHDISAMINPNTFVCLVQSSAGPELIADCLSSILIQHRKYMDSFGIGSFVCTAEKCEGQSYREVLGKCSEEAEKLVLDLSGRRLLNHYREMSEMRDYIFMDPSATFDTSSLHERFSGSTGYFRSVYKQCFGSSFHKDCINARIAKAKYQLVTSTMSIMEISEKCGYLDSKYFLRQFNSAVGMTPVKYRSLLKS